MVHASNRLAVRLLPSDVLVRVAPRRHGAAALEIDLAASLASIGAPVATLDPRVAPRVYEQDGFAITFWTFYERQTGELPPADYAAALGALHDAMRRVDLPTPHFLHRVREAAAAVANADPATRISNADRDLLQSMLAAATQAIREKGAAEQLLHGEPHPMNVLSTKDGPLFIDLETCCRGPVDFDLAHVPEKVSDLYPGVDPTLLGHCRELVLAMVAAWRLEPGDELPGGENVLREILLALRAGPPYPPLGAIAGLA